VSQLAQANVARLRADLDDPGMSGFATALDAVNALAERSPGFVWRLAADGGHGLCVLTDDGGPAFLNLSVWRDYAALHTFVYRSEHGGFVRERRRWFVATRQPSTVLWWVADGARPTVQDATRRLDHLRKHGPSPRAFSLRRRFPPTRR
jgi:hypothetical protein